MATPVDTLLVEVTADLRDVRRKLGQLEKETKRTADRSAQNMGRLATAIKTVVGAVIVREFARAGLAAVNFASHVEEAQAKSSVVFGRFTDKIRGDLKAFATEVGRSEFQLEEMAASVQDTFVPMGFARGEAADLSVQLAKLATDVASFNNASDVETMRAFQSALVGNHETVRRFGIVITEAELQAEIFRMGIRKSKDELTAAEKVQARMNLILAGTTDAQGDAARTADSYANQVKRMEAETDRLQKAIGDSLMPTMVELVKAVSSAASELTRLIQGPDLGKLGNINREIAETEQRIAELNEEADEKGIVGYFTDLVVGSGLARIAEKNRHDETRANLEREKKRLDELIEARRQLQRGDDSEEKPAKQGGQSEITKKKVNDLLKEQADAMAVAQMRVDGLANSQVLLEETSRKLGVLTPEQTIQFMMQADALEDLKLKMQAIDEVQGALQDGVQALSEGTSQAITDMVTGVGDGMENLKNVVSNAINTIIQKMIEMYVVNKAINAALGFFGAPQSMMLPTAGGGRGSAGGGAIMPNTPMLVGERGPELIIPKSASVVKNAADTRGMMGGGSPVVVNQSLNFSTGVQATVRSEVMTMMPQIQEATKAAVSEQAQRGGSYARAF